MNTRENRDDYNLSSEEKIEAFDKIAELYFSGNFGTMAKSDFETLLFSIYIEHCFMNRIPFDDYTLSRNLGITQSRVRSLKLKKELKYPWENFRWEAAFAEEIKHARYDETRRLVKVGISDVNVMVELRHFMEQNGWYDEYQLNPKLFQCRLDFFIDLCERLEGKRIVLDDNAKEQLIELKNASGDEKEKSAIEKILSGSVEDGAKEFLINASRVGITELLKLLPFGGVAGVAINGLISLLEKS